MRCSSDRVVVLLYRARALQDALCTSFNADACRACAAAVHPLACVRAHVAARTRRSLAVMPHGCYCSATVTRPRAPLTTRAPPPPSRAAPRRYGMLQGRLKRDVAHEHGVDLTQKWRRSYDIAPPAVPGARGYFPAGDRKYASLTDDDAPESWCGSAQTESLKDTQARAWRLWKERIAPRVRGRRTCLVVGHGNVIRAMLKRLDGIGNERLREVCIPRAVPLVYELDAEMRPVRSAYAFGALSGYFLANPKQIAAALKIESTEAQLGLRAGADPGETSSSSGSPAPAAS
eukprot:TRINITY_DN8929_c0_g1_i1.p1 TRINITY_DN8929_c0_g1~~TRINITY_DN8929_c0_g1_i1.p1  ORF type:complete len:289 (+),score=76.18 TRINITY_DN8929_c0_g1_i1:807-1673(+)